MMQRRIDEITWSVIMISTIALAIFGVHEVLQRMIGTEISKIVMFPIILSFWFNSKCLYEWIKSE